MLTEELKKQIRTIDLALAAGLKRKSSRTGFIHDAETIPIYENFCFVLALFRHKTADSVTEGKELIERLLPFQSEQGNFPIYLHDFPRCYDPHMGLRVAPIMIYLLRLFGPVLGELKLRVEAAVLKAVSKRPEKPFWENRYRACVGEPLLPVNSAEFSPIEWSEWLITAQLSGQTHFAIPYDESLQLFMGPSRFDVQERGEPRPNPVEWLLADGVYSARLLRDHPHQLYLAPLFPITYEKMPIEETSFRLFWKGTTIHSLVAKSLVFDLPETVEFGRHDVFEVALFTDLSPETTLLINGRKATTFQLGDVITIHTPEKKIELRFDQTVGNGEFCGHIFRANRPSQAACKGEDQYAAYDWQIGLRTLRRLGPSQITVSTG